MTTSSQLRLEVIREAFGISREQMARLLDLSKCTIECWEERTEPPTGMISRSHLAKLQEIADLGLIVYGPERFQRYVSLPMPVFGGWSALQLIEQGDANRVLGALAADYEGQSF